MYYCQVLGPVGLLRMSHGSRLGGGQGWISCILLGDGHVLVRCEAGGGREPRNSI